MLKFIDGFRTSLCTHLQTTGGSIMVSASAVRKLNEELSIGDHVYLSIRYQDRYEVVKYTKHKDIKGLTIDVERDVLGKGRKNFPDGSCVVVDWNSIQMKEFICQNKDC